MSHSYIHTQRCCAGVNSIDTLNWPRRAAWERRSSPGPGFVSSALAAAFAAILLCVGPAVMAADDSSIHFEISAKPLAVALMEFGKQSGLTVVAPTTLTAGKKASDVRGEFTPAEALGRLLKGSGLTFARAADGTIAIEAINASAPAQANARESGSGKDSTTDPDQLSEVIVTAQRRSEALLQVAAAVTAVQASDLARQGNVRLADYAATVPGLNLISSQPGQTVVIIRGVSTGFGAAIAATTATYIDDSPYGSSTANALGSFTTIDLDPATLQRVEVLRGPQGTLYGATGMGGLIKYVTTPPSLTEYGGRVELDGNSVDGGGQGYGVRAMWTGPLITDKLGVTLNAFNRLDPGYIDDPQLDKKNVNSSRVEGGRLAFLWQPTDQFSAQLSALVQDSATGGTSYTDVNANLTPIYGKYTQIRYGSENWDLDSTHYSLRATYDFGWAALTSITSYQTQSARWFTDFTNRFGPLLSGILGVPDLGVFDHVSLADHKITQEVRFASADSDILEWLGGFFFTHERSVQPEQFQNPFSTLTGAIVPVPGGIFTDPNHDSYTEYAGYADVTYHLTSNFKILGGLRFTSDSENNITPFSGILNGPPSVALATTSSNTVTYLVSPSYNIDDRNMIYIRVATGFRPGGPTGLTTTSVYAGAPSTYGPDTLTNYELGYKASFPEQRMTVDVSGFDIEWKNIQVLSEIGGFLITGNGGDARSAGAELAWTWRPITGLNLSANAAYTDAHLTADAPGISAKAGDKLPDVPEFSANLAADYDFPLTTEVKGFVGGNFQHQGARVSDFVSGTPPGYERPSMPSYNTVNLHAGLSRGGITGEAYIKNVVDAYGLTRIASEVQNGYGPPLAAAVIPPRTFGLSISDKF
jgi:outer membrane receptor protein involved in Fe transport